MDKTGGHKAVILILAAYFVWVHHQFAEEGRITPGIETKRNCDGNDYVRDQWDRISAQYTISARSTAAVTGMIIILAARKPMCMKNWWIGCSGFYYKPWREKFYPPGLPQRKWFEFYCEHFNTVELNVTFYRFPKLEDLKGWYKRSPEDFKFTVKAPRLITHYKRFHNAARETNDFYNSVRQGLDNKLGCVLFQLHPGMEFKEENLDRILGTMDLSYTNVIEFRHPSWWCEKVLSALKREGITFCSISYPNLPDEVFKTAATMYYRFHGVPHLYLSSYSNEKLIQIGGDIKKLRGVKDVYCYFNNDIEVAAVSNAKNLQDIVEPHPVLSRA
jgi:uncharacterized protein YecE (DUF72 family)